jgi:hypothetical protein
LRKAFCDLPASARIAKTRRTKEREQNGVSTETRFALQQNAFKQQRITNLTHWYQKNFVFLGIRSEG